MVKVNYFSVRSSSCIATCALYKSADVFAEVYPEECRAVKEETYTDDELTAATDKEAALLKTQHMNEICGHACMSNRGWTFTGNEKKEDVLIDDNEEAEDEKVFGTSWEPKSDMFKFKVKLKLIYYRKKRTISKQDSK